MGGVKVSLVVLAVTFCWVLAQLVTMLGMTDEEWEEPKITGKYPWYTYVTTILVLLSGVGIVYDLIYFLICVIRRYAG